MAVNKVVYGTTVLVDLTNDTVTPSALAAGYTAHDKSGAAIVGTAQTGGAVITERADSHGGTVKVITTDGSIDLSSDTVDASHLLSGYTAHDKTGAAITGSYVAPTFSTQAKTVTPTESMQTVTPDSSHDGLSSVTVNPIPSQYVVPSGTVNITENGTHDVTGYASASVNVSGGSSTNVQVGQSTTRIANTTYTKACSLTCTTTGTYDVYWDCFRSTTSGTSGSQLYVGGSASGSANTAFSNHAQSNHRTGVHITAGQEVAVYARSRATNYYAYVSQLTIVQTA